MMNKHALILATTLFTIACAVTPPYNIKKTYGNKTLNIEISGGIQPKEANKIIDHLYSNMKLINDKFAIPNINSLSRISHWVTPSGSTGIKHTECKYEVTYYIQNYGGETLCVGIYENKLKALWSSRWVE